MTEEFLKARGWMPSLRYDRVTWWHVDHAGGHSFARAVALELNPHTDDDKYFKRYFN